MKTVSSSIKQALAQPTTIRKGKIVILDNNSNLEKQVFNVEYYADCYDEGNIVGNAIATELKFDTDYLTKFDKFKYYEGIYTGNDFEYIDMGTFEVFDEENTENYKKRVTAYNNLIRFNAQYVDSIEYPCTLYELLENICQQATVDLMNEEIPNGTFVVEDNQFVNGETLKTILKAICSISGTFAMIKDDKLFLNLINETQEEIGKSYHATTNWKRRTYGINQVVIGMKEVTGEYVIRQDDEDIELNGIHKLTINDNPFSYTQDKREELIEDLYEQVLGFGYIPYEQKGEWLPYLELGDTISIDGVNTIVLRILGKSPGAVDSEMSAPAIIDSAVDYVDNTDDIDNRLRRTEITVDKANQEISSIAQITDNTVELVNQTGEQIEALGTRLTQTTEGITTQVTSIQEQLSEGASLVKTTSVTIDDNGLTVATDTSEISTTMNNEEFKITSGSETLAWFGYDNTTNETKSEVNNLTVDKYFIVGNHRVEAYDNDGEGHTGFFYIGGS